MYLSHLFTFLFSTSFALLSSAAPTEPSSVDLGNGASVTLDQLKSIMRDPFAVTLSDSPYTVTATDGTLTPSLVESVLAGNGPQEQLHAGGAGLSRRGGARNLHRPGVSGCFSDVHLCLACDNPSDNPACHKCYYGN
ncbi:hypothetical protein DFJ73DRAFT_961722 [Zopfochytrium polystomum]|nr:hypothetical protein DFJ73DRAFT_961722 [Zopfochytrium polystomum]